MPKRALTSEKTMQPTKRSKYEEHQQANSSNMIGKLNIPAARLQRRLEQQSSKGKDKSLSTDRFTSKTIRRNATTKRTKVSPGVSTSSGINENRNSKYAASSIKKHASAKRSCGHTYNLRSKQHESKIHEGRENSNHLVTLSGSSRKDVSKLFRLKKSLPSRGASKTFSGPIQKHSVVARKLRSHNVKIGASSIPTGIAITNDGRILLVDRNYGTVKAFYRNMKMQSSIRLYEYIWDITVINDNEAFVGVESTDSNKYVILDISGNQLKVIRTHPLPFSVYATCRLNDKLIAVTRDSCQAVKMFDMTGKVYWTLSQHSFGHSLYPSYVATRCDARGSSVIATDQEMNAVLLIDGQDGKIKKKVYLIGKSPRGVTTDSEGNVYICLFERNEIIVLTADLSVQKVLLTKKDKLRGYPQAIAYNKNTQCLLISYMYSGFLDIFQIS